MCSLKAMLRPPKEHRLTPVGLDCCSFSFLKFCCHLDRLSKPIEVFFCFVCRVTYWAAPATDEDKCLDSGFRLPNWLNAATQAPVD